MMPVSTSPAPAVASHGGALQAIAARPSGAAMRRVADDPGRLDLVGAPEGFEVAIAVAFGHPAAAAAALTGCGRTRKACRCSDDLP